MSRPDDHGETDLELVPIASSSKQIYRVMAPDRGSPKRVETEAEEAPHVQNGTMLNDSDDDSHTSDISTEDGDEARRMLTGQAEQGQNFTVRGVLVGLVIGVVICFSNTYFGLQTGWVSGMAMPASLIGFGFFKTVSRCINYPFTPVENVLVQTVAGAVGTMPLGCGFVGVMPALNFLLKTEENGPIAPETWKLMVWAIGICFFGVVIAVPLRKEVIIREKLKFPSGTATALMIGVVHGNTDKEGNLKPDSGLEIFRRRSLDIQRSLTIDEPTQRQEDGTVARTFTAHSSQLPNDERNHREDWKAKIRLLIYAFAVSAIYVRMKLFYFECHAYFANRPLSRTSSLN